MKWEIQVVEMGSSAAQAELRKLLTEGWEPYAVTTELVSLTISMAGGGRAVCKTTHFLKRQVSS